MDAITRYVLPLRSGEQVGVADNMPDGSAVATVLALPGWKGSDLGVRSLVQPLMRRGYRVVTMNFPGMGVSPTISGRSYDMGKLIDIVDAVIGELMPVATSLTLVGHSFGATVATATAQRRSHVLQGLVLISPVVIPLIQRRDLPGRLSWTTTKISMTLLRQLPDDVAIRIVKSRLVDAMTTAALTRRGLTGYRRIREASRAERHLAPELTAVLEQMQAAACDGCLRFAATKLPTWILAGAADAMSNVGELKQLGAAMCAQLALIPGAGHLAHHEDGPELAQLLVRAVDSIHHNLGHGRGGVPASD